MKPLLFGFAAIVIFSGCTTTPEATRGPAGSTHRPTQYAVQIIEAKIQGDELGDLYPELFWDPNKEPMEGIEVTTIEDLFSSNPQPTTRGADKPRAVSLPRPDIAQATIDKIRNLNGADVFEYPMFYASPGETAICDQTESMEIPQDYDVVGEKTVKKTESVKLGHYAEILITHDDRETVTGELKVESRQLHGMEKSPQDNGAQVEMPLYDHARISTIIPLQIKKWTLNCVTTEEQNQNGKTMKSAHVLLIRVMPNGDV